MSIIHTVFGFAGMYYGATSAPVPLVAVSTIATAITLSNPKIRQGYISSGMAGIALGGIVSGVGSLLGKTGGLVVDGAVKIGNLMSVVTPDLVVNNGVGIAALSIVVGGGGYIIGSEIVKAISHRKENLSIIKGTRENLVRADEEIRKQKREVEKRFLTPTMPLIVERKRFKCNKNGEFDFFLQKDKEGNIVLDKNGNPQRYACMEVSKDAYIMVAEDFIAPVKKETTVMKNNNLNKDDCVCVFLPCKLIRSNVKEGIETHMDDKVNIIHGYMVKNKEIINFRCSAYSVINAMPDLLTGRREQREFEFELVKGPVHPIKPQQPINLAPDFKSQTENNTLSMK